MTAAPLVWRGTGESSPGVILAVGEFGYIPGVGIVAGDGVTPASSLASAVPVPNLAQLGGVPLAGQGVNAWRSRDALPSRTLQRLVYPSATAPTVTFAENPTNSQIKTTTAIFSAVTDVIAAGSVSVFDGCNMQHPSSSFPQSVIYQPFSMMLQVDTSIFKTSYSIHFYSDAAKVELIWLGVAGGTYRIWVDDQALGGLTPIVKNGTGSPESVLLDFTSVGGAAVRRFRLDLAGPYLMGVVLDSAERTIWPAEQRGPTMFMFGDSLTGGSAISTSLAAQIPHYLGNLFGWDNVWDLGIGGTGYLASNGPGGVNNDALAQVQYLAPSNATPSTTNPGSSTPIPDIVSIAYGHNDSMNQATATAAGVVVAQARSQWPNAFIVVIGPLGNGVQGGSFYIPTENEIFTAVAPFANATISMWQGVGRPWLVGTGDTSAVAGNGNNDLYIGSDGTHWNDAGIAYVSTRLAPVLRSLLSA